MPAYAHHGVTWGMTQPYLGKKLIKEETNERERMVSHLDYSTDATPGWRQSPDNLPRLTIGCWLSSWAPAITLQHPSCPSAILVIFSPTWKELSDSTLDSQQFYPATQEFLESMGDLNTWFGFNSNN